MLAIRTPAAVWPAMQAPAIAMWVERCEPLSPDTFEEYRDTSRISIAMLLQKYAALLAASDVYTTLLNHDTPPIPIVILLQSFAGSSGVVGTPPKKAVRGTIAIKGIIDNY